MLRSISLSSSFTCAILRSSASPHLWNPLSTPALAGSWVKSLAARFSEAEIARTDSSKKGQVLSPLSTPPKHRRKTCAVHSFLLQKGVFLFCSKLFSEVLPENFYLHHHGPGSHDYQKDLTNGEIYCFVKCCPCSFEREINGSSSITASTVISFSVQRPLTPSCQVLCWESQLKLENRSIHRYPARPLRPPFIHGWANPFETIPLLKDSSTFFEQTSGGLIEQSRSSTVSLRPPVGDTMGKVPKRMASICTRPQGSHLTQHKHHAPPPRKTATTAASSFSKMSYTSGPGRQQSEVAGCQQGVTLRAHPASIEELVRVFLLNGLAEICGWHKRGLTMGLSVPSGCVSKPCTP